jgi:DMSO/TMAO reductase YedYZ molybdopterin-dependent catalytic subunit
MATVTRGFFGRRRERDPRLPPGQYDARDEWPVLHAEATPRLTTDRWTFTVSGLVDRETSWSWDEIHALPRSRYEGDIHCVTTWSKLGMTFDGVSVDTLLDAAGVRPEATHVVAVAHTGYTTNLPLSDVTDGKAWVVWDADGRPLTTEHGGPRACSCRTCTSGRARSGCRACACSTTTSPGSGNATATTTAGIRGRSSGTRETERSLRSERRY